VATTPRDPVRVLLLGVLLAAAGILAVVFAARTPADLYRRCLRDRSRARRGPRPRLAPARLVSEPRGSAPADACRGAHRCGRFGCDRDPAAGVRCRGVRASAARTRGSASQPHPLDPRASQHQPATSAGRDAGKGGRGRYRSRRGCGRFPHCRSLDRVPDSRRRAAAPLAAEDDSGGGPGPARSNAPARGDATCADGWRGSSCSC
jgi:hypothetical protein